MLPKTRGLYFCRGQYGSNFDAIGPKATEFGEIAQNNGHYAVQGHLRSSLSVSIESLYMRLPVSE